MPRRAIYRLALTPHQRAALLTVLSEHVTRPDATEVSIDAATGEEIVIADLIGLLMNIEPTILEETAR